MTEEEYFRKNYPDSCYGDRPLSPYWDFFQDGTEFGERQSEKKIEKLEKENTDIRDNYDQFKAIAVPEIERLKKENAELKELLNCNNCSELSEEECEVCAEYSHFKCKRKDQLIKAKEHIRTLISCLIDWVQEGDKDYCYIEDAKQFIKE